MTINVEIPSVFAMYAGNRTSFEIEGKTVLECIRDLGKKYPELENMIVTKDGVLQNYIDIFINGETAYPKALTRKLKDGDKLNIIMLIHGG